MMKVVLLLIFILGLSLSPLGSESELTEYLKEDTRILALPMPVPAKVFDFTLQREMNRELRGK